jgi:hypothetical protein
MEQFFKVFIRPKQVAFNGAKMLATVLVLDSDFFKVNLYF